MSFSWGEALRIALTGFIGVFTILFILEISVVITSALVRRFGKKPAPEKQETKS
jgi:Na+-transporting methylmalonyl-CoA/oxaloacetate decarboxylase gamma subunit